MDTVAGSSRTLIVTAPQAQEAVRFVISSKLSVPTVPTVPTVPKTAPKTICAKNHALRAGIFTNQRPSGVGTPDLARKVKTEGLAGQRPDTF
jgi:hypothetical protein